MCRGGWFLPWIFDCSEAMPLRPSCPADAQGRVLCHRSVNVFREQDGERGFGGEHASGVVPAEWNHDKGVPGAELLIYVFGERLAAGEAGGALGHGGAGAIEAGQRQEVGFAREGGQGRGAPALFSTV